MAEGRSAAARARALDYRVDPFDLRLYAAVLERGTITAGAQAVGLSLAAASERIGGLEHVVGTPLLTRSRQGASPTEAGHVLARHARRVLAELDALHLGLAGYGSGLRGSLRLAANTAALADALPACLGSFLAAHPDIDLDLRERSSDAVLEALHGDAADLGIVADYVDPQGLVVHPWREDRLVAVLPAGHALASARALAFADLLDQPFVGLPPDRGLGRFLLRQSALSGRLPRQRVCIGGFEAMLQLVAAGVGLAILPQACVRRHRPAGLRTVALSDPWARRRLLLCRRPDAGEREGVLALERHLLAGTDTGTGTAAAPVPDTPPRSTPPVR